MITVGEKLIQHLEARNVEVVFGIPGVHTIEHYKGLSASAIRHVTPRHEQGAAFMADGYARVSGKPGVALVITGPGVTNTITAMAQARADSIPLLIISAVNPLKTANKSLGCLHELPDQQATMNTIALRSIQVRSEIELADAFKAAFEIFESKRPGPVHIELPYDVAAQPATEEKPIAEKFRKPVASREELEKTIKHLSNSESPLIVAGGGVRNCRPTLEKLAELLDAPVVMTTNARGLMYQHVLSVPASPSLAAVRELIGDSDVVLVLGSELGRTDFDMYATGELPNFKTMIRVDISPEQLAAHDSDLKICGDAPRFIEQLTEGISEASKNGAARAAGARKNAFEELDDGMKRMSGMLDTLRDAVPGSIFVGDSTQAIYAGNLFYDHDRPGGWFNSSTGYGTLGYAIPAAIGASLAASGERIFCLVGDGGAQFSLPELMVATDEALPITFVIWNNSGYGEIETTMIAQGVTPVGCDPSPPDFGHIAAASGMPYFKTGLVSADVTTTIHSTLGEPGPVLFEIEF
ncbi:MAG: 5-guanidino-2-oxopentanoate decarboxylase [Pseudomonadota bacterium]